MHSRPYTQNIEVWFGVADIMSLQLEALDVAPGGPGLATCSVDTTWKPGNRLRALGFAFGLAAFMPA